MLRKCAGTQECTTLKGHIDARSISNKEHTEVDRADRIGGHADTSHREQIAGIIAQGNEHNARVYNVQDGQHAEADKAQASATCRKGQRG